MTSGSGAAHVRVAAAIQQLAATHAGLAVVLAGLTTVVADEAARNAGFRVRLSEILVVGRQGDEAHLDGIEAAPPTDGPSEEPVKAAPKRGRRVPGPWDPYVVYAEVGEAGLKERLGALELEQLRDIVAEHGMNHDGKAMRWKTTDRVIGRIVERVVDRSGKGDAFRSA